MIVLEIDRVLQQSMNDLEIQGYEITVSHICFIVVLFYCFRKDMNFLVEEKTHFYHYLIPKSFWLDVRGHILLLATAKKA